MQLRRTLNEKQDLLLLLGCASLLVTLKLMVFSNNNVNYDEGVYIGIARYFSSFGKEAFFEYFRPFGLPLLLTPLQWLPIAPLFTGRLLSLALCIVSLVIVYSVTRDSCGTRAARWAALLFTTSVPVLGNAGIVLPDIPAYALALLGVHLAYKGRMFLAGVVTAVAFHLKFPALGVLLPIIIYLVWTRKQAALRPLLRLSIGVGLVLLPYFAFNLVWYEGPLFHRIVKPLTDYSSLVSTTVEGVFFPVEGFLRVYLTHLVLFEPVIFFGLLIGFAFSKKEKRGVMALIFSCALFYFLYFSLKVNQFVLRHILSFLTFMCVAAGASVVRVLDHWPRRKRLVVSGLVLVIALSTAAVTVWQRGSVLQHDRDLVQALAALQDGVVTNQARVLLYAPGMVRLLPSPQLGDTYLRWRLDENSPFLAVDPSEYTCYDEVCSAAHDRRVAWIARHHDIEVCGYLYGAPMLVVSKSQPDSSATEGCLARMGIDSISQHEQFIGMRLYMAGWDANGRLIGLESLERIVDVLDESGIPGALLMYPTSHPSDEESARFLSGLPGSVLLGVILSEGTDTRSFMEMIKSSTNRTIEAFTPAFDYFQVSGYNVSEGLTSCFHGPWDASPSPVPCHAIDLYLYEGQGELALTGEAQFRRLFDLYRDSDDEIWVSVPVNNLNANQTEEIISVITYMASSGVSLGESRWPT